MSEFAKESLSLEETNKLRISLGLKPLTDDSAGDSKPKDGGSEPLDKDEVAEDNYRERMQEEAKRKEDEEIRQRIARAQNKRDLRKQLRGPTLGDADPSDEQEAGPSDAKSTLKWLKQTQKKAKENAAKRAKDLEEQEAAAQATYGEADLAGLRVAHDYDDFDLQGDEGRILTLRDSKILDGDEDELMDATLEQRELDRRNEERKRGPKKYTGLDDDEMEEASGSRRKVDILSQYDADIPQSGRGDGDAGFRLGGSNASSEERKKAKQKELEEEARLQNRTLLNLDYSKNQEVSDYLSPNEVTFKKPKSKKKRPVAQRVKLDLEDEDEAGTSTAGGDVEMAAPVVHARRQAEEKDNLIDDDELAASLAKARRAKAKKAISKMTPEQIAKNLAEQRAAEEEEERRKAGGPSSIAGASRVTDQQGESAGIGGQEEGLTFDETAEFIRNIGRRPNELEEESFSRRRNDSGQATANGSTDIKREPQEALDSVAMPSQNGSAETIKDEDMDYADYENMEKYPSPPPEGDYDDDDGDDDNDEADKDGTGASDSTSEAPVSGGLASTLSLLRSQGLLEGYTPEQRRREIAQKQNDAWKARHQAEEALREQEKTMSKLQGSAKDQATREYENKMRELEEARRAEDRFKDYNPDVDIKYHDQHGRTLSTLESWKQLSYRFHGKMPGKAKQEKMKRRVEEERKRERMAAGDAADMASAFRDRQAREGQAHMVLSVGAKGNAPQAFADSIGPNLVNQKHLERQRAKNKAGPSGSRASSSRTAGESSLSPYPPTDGFRSVGMGRDSSATATATASMSGFASTHSISASDTPTMQQPSSGPPVGSRMKPAFQPVTASATGGFSPVPARTAEGGQNGTSAPIGGGGFKLSLGGVAGGKRKADEQGGR